MTAEKTALENSLKTQADQTKAREQKAAGECERMFKLVQVCVDHALCVPTDDRAVLVAGGPREGVKQGEGIQASTCG
eukprot:SAG31_NODE_141_length_22675_cov_48.948879_20_plen_77_part_00